MQNEVKIIMADGCMIDDNDAFQLLDKGTELFVVNSGEELQLPSSSRSAQHGIYFVIYESIILHCNNVFTSARRRSGEFVRWPIVELFLLSVIACWSLSVLGPK